MSVSVVHSGIYFAARKNIFSLIFYLSGILGLYLASSFVNPLNAQDSPGNYQKASISVKVGAEVESSIEIVTMRHIRFGKVQPSQQIIDINPVTDNETGKMKILGQASNTIRISYQENQSLQQMEGANSIDFRYQLAGNSMDNQSTSDFIDFNNFEAQLNQDGEYYIWVGGNVRVANLQPGSYEGDFTVEVEYM